MGDDEDNNTYCVKKGDQATLDEIFLPIYRNIYLHLYHCNTPRHRYVTPASSNKVGCFWLRFHHSSDSESDFGILAQKKTD